MVINALNPRPPNRIQGVLAVRVRQRSRVLLCQPLSNDLHHLVLAILGRRITLFNEQLSLRASELCRNDPDVCIREPVGTDRLDLGVDMRTPTPEDEEEGVAPALQLSPQREMRGLQQRSIGGRTNHRWKWTTQVGEHHHMTQLCRQRASSCFPESNAPPSRLLLSLPRDQQNVWLRADGRPPVQEVSAPSSLT